jgi:hypothetical protein
MGIEFIGRIIKTSLVVSAFVLIFGSVYYDWNYSLGISIGLAYNCVNLWLIMGLVRRFVTLGERRPVPILAFSMIKFPLFYFIGYLIMKVDIVPVSSLVTGFTLLFGIIVLKVLGRLMAGSNWMDLADSKKRASQ